MSTRQEVFDAVAVEMEYSRYWQEKADKEGIRRVSDREKTVPDWLQYIGGYLQEAQFTAAHVVTSPINLDFVKLLNLAMTCMMWKGAPARYPIEATVIGRFCEAPLNFQQVCHLVTEEREYQDALPPSRTDGGGHSLNGYLTMFYHYFRRAEDAWTQNPGCMPCLDVVRKLAGIATHALEDHGVRTRPLKFRDQPIIEGVDFAKLGAALHRIREGGLMAKNPKGCAILEEMQAVLNSI